MNEILLATAIGEETTLGVLPIEDDIPVQRGNCFSLEGRTGEKRWDFRIVNFCVENFRYVIRHGIQWPVKIVPLSERVAIIHDERIPEQWYSQKYCETCCPEELLPTPQIMAHRRQEARGERTIIKGDGQVRFGFKSFDVCRIDPGKRATLPARRLEFFKNWRAWCPEGSKVAIVGKGPSLDSIRHADLAGYAEIFCLNESVQVIEKVSERAVMVIQQDCDEEMGSLCVPKNQASVHFMNAFQAVYETDRIGKKVVKKVAVSPWNPNAVLYDPLEDFGLQATSELSVIMALHLAKYMGLRHVTFLCFDSWLPGGSCEYAASLKRGMNDGIERAEGGGRHATYKDYVLTQARQMGIVTEIGYPAEVARG